ncbi:MAG: metallophosphoesterase [Polyangiaceae bacterium]|nr:metallophosphoesterase [Polyangiaceae bacterium]
MVERLRIAAIGDLHCGKESSGVIARALAGVSEAADVLLLCGDLTDYGTLEEAKILAREVAGIRIPILGVLGNHDFESDKAEEVTSILADAGVRILDGGTFMHRDVGFAGIKGFCGGFGRGTLGHWGEPVLKRFVQEAIDEELKLETALARLHMVPTRVVLMHYSPVRATVIGEPEEIHAFLGCSRLEEPLARNAVAAVFHGHAHRGTPEGKTHARGTPVYNVAWPLTRRLAPERPAYRVIEIDVVPPEEDVPVASLAH